MPHVIQQGTPHDAQQNRDAPQRLENHVDPFGRGAGDCDLHLHRQRHHDRAEDKERIEGAAEPEDGGEDMQPGNDDL
jgi:hypothetical protein